ncbi:MAG: hypothetical protein VKJ24_11535 [Synechococcales bacterium]|nr:hypothetical protein [Synechococcales bacterium]
MKWANPLLYPLVMVGTGLVLIGGTRFLRLPPLVTLPIAAGVALVGATVRQKQHPDYSEIADPDLVRELRDVKTNAIGLKTRAAALHLEASKYLTGAAQVDLLASMQMACDRAVTFPARVDALGDRLAQTDSILSVEELRSQLKEAQQSLKLAKAQQKQHSSSGIASQQLEDLIQSLQRNLQLAQDGEDTRLAQVISLATVMQDLAGALQKLQNKLRLADVNDPEQVVMLQGLSEELISLENNFDLLTPS